jgi:hypothetical protein
LINDQATALSGKFAEAERAPPTHRFEAREAGFAALGSDATEGRLRRLSSATSRID